MTFRFWDFRKGGAARRDMNSEVDACLDALSRGPGRGPDLTESILSRVGSVVPLCSVRERRWLTAGRVTIAACALVCVGVGASIYRTVSDTAVILAGGASARPISNVVNSAYRDVNAAMASVASAGQLAALLRPAVVTRPVLADTATFSDTRPVWPEARPRGRVTFSSLVQPFSGERRDLAKTVAYELSSPSSDSSSLPR